MTGKELVIGMAGSLRGHSIVLYDLHLTKKHLTSGREEEGDVGSYIVSGLIGIFKGEMGERCQLNQVAPTTD